MYFSTRLDRQNRASSQNKASFIAVGQRLDIALVIFHDNGRFQIRPTCDRRGVSNNALADARSFIGVFRNGDTLDQVFKLNLTAQFREDRDGIRFPFSQTVTARYGLPLFDTQARAISQLVASALQTVIVHYLNDDITAHYDIATRRVLHDVGIFQLNLTVSIGFDEGLVNNLRRTTNVESPHGQLCSWLTNRLRGNHTNGLAHIDRRTTSQVAAVTFGANTRFGFAGQH